MNRKWWKAYFFVALALTVFAFALPLVFDEEREAASWEWSYVPLYMIQLVGLFGFAYWRRIATPLVWQLVFVASIVYETWDLYSIATELGAARDHVSFLVSTVAVTLLLQIPMLVGLYLYGFRCRELWRSAT